MDTKLNGIKSELERLMTGDPALVGARYVQVLELLDDLARQQQPPLERIQAQEVRMVVTDAESGQTSMCLLPLSYAQSANGVTISGETYAAESVQIAFLSEFAVEKLRDLQGFGADQPRCDHSEDDKIDK